MAKQARVSTNPFTPTPLDAARAVRDKAVLMMDAKWGVDVLQGLVSPATAAKFAAVCQRRDIAIEEGDDEAAIDAMNVEVRGLAAMDAEAVAAGKQPLKEGRSWATRAVDGTPVLLVQTDDDARAAHASGRFKGYMIYSLREVMAILSDRSLLGVLDIKKTFPSASIEKVVKPPVDWRKGDEVGL